MVDIRSLPFILEESLTPEDENVSTDWYPGLVLVLAIFVVWMLVRHFAAKKRTR